WDVINEVVIMPVFDRGENGIKRMAQRLGRVGIVEATFAAARETNHGATLLLNDFDMSADYEHLIEGCLEAGIRIDALGLQSHAPGLVGRREDGGRARPLLAVRP